MWYEINCRDRILAWREWRKSLDLMPWDECVANVATTCEMVPRVNHYLVPDEIESWPTPWQLINDNMYCDLSVALLMFYSLALTKHPESEDIRLHIYKNSSGWVNLCLIGPDKSVLNWHSGAVVNTVSLPSDLILIYSYSKIDLVSKLD